MDREAWHAAVPWVSKNWTQLSNRDQIANICLIVEKAREFQKNIYFCCIDYAKAFNCVDPNKLWKMVKEMGISDHLTSILRILYAGQSVTQSVQLLSHV